MLIVIGVYILQFYFNLKYQISEKPSDWVDFSNFFNGLVTPLLSFFSLVLLIQSLSIQNQTNTELRDEVRKNKKKELLQSFEIYFFGLIEAQRNAFNNLKLSFSIQLDEQELSNVKLIQELEDSIEAKRAEGVSTENIRDFINTTDANESIFNTTRIFYNVVRMITEKLTNENGFESLERKNQFKTLISFTEFSQLRLIMISMQFMDWESAKYLKENDEFIEVLKDLGGGTDLY